jgi:phycocyanobilin:ferredoxin oxidoreductase
MSSLWNKLIDLEKYFESKFYETGSIIPNYQAEPYQKYGLIEKVWASSIYRKAQISIFDLRETKGIWMLHCCVYPHTNNNAPIFGFDIVAGRNKVTGCFIDYSPLTDIHPMTTYFTETIENMEWTNVRELPEWAKPIFSKSMVSIGKFKDDENLDQTLDLGKELLDHYLETVGQSKGTVENNTQLQNFYCQQQKLNPRTAKVMETLGIPAEQVSAFIDKCMFPEIN